MVDGMAYLKIYENQACTRELAKDSAGDYILDIPLLTSNTQSPFQIILWVRNEGSHSAYDSSVTIVSSTITNTAVETTLTSPMYPMEVKKVAVTMPVSQGATGNHRVVLRTYYDSI